MWLIFHHTYNIIRNLLGHFSSTMTHAAEMSLILKYLMVWGRCYTEKTMEGRCGESHSLHEHLHYGVITVQVLINTKGRVIISWHHYCMALLINTLCYYVVGVVINCIHSHCKMCYSINKSAVPTEFKRNCRMDKESQIL